MTRRQMNSAKQWEHRQEVTELFGLDKLRTESLVQLIQDGSQEEFEETIRERTESDPFEPIIADAAIVPTAFEQEPELQPQPEVQEDQEELETLDAVEPPLPPEEPEGPSAIDVLAQVTANAEDRITKETLTPPPQTPQAIQDAQTAIEAPIPQDFGVELPPPEGIGLLEQGPLQEGPTDSFELPESTPEVDSDEPEPATQDEGTPEALPEPQADEPPSEPPPPEQVADEVERQRETQEGLGDPTEQESPRQNVASPDADEAEPEQPTKAQEARARRREALLKINAARDEEQQQSFQSQQTYAAALKQDLLRSRQNQFQGPFAKDFSGVIPNGDFAAEPEDISVSSDSFNNAAEGYLGALAKLLSRLTEELIERKEEIEAIEDVLDEGTS